MPFYCIIFNILIFQAHSVFTINLKTVAKIIYCLNEVEGERNLLPFELYFDTFMDYYIFLTKLIS